jgi:signal transduction histidine kinase
MDSLSEKYWTAVAHAEDLIVVSDGFRDMADLEAARIRVLSRRLLGRLGLSAAEIEGWEGKALGDFFRRYVEDREGLARLFERLRRAYVVDEAALCLTCGGRALEVGGRSQVVPSPDEGYYFLGVFQDLTRQRRLEAELQGERAERAEWDAFIRHELRGKLGPVIGFSELLMTHYDKFPEARVQEFLKAIYDTGQRLNRILDLTREFQTYERGEIGVAWAERDVYETVRSAIQEAAAAVREAAADHPALWELAPHAGDGARPLPLPHDPLKVQRALRNLIQNAWEHSREAVTLRVEDAGDGVEIRVCNGGEPIEPGRLARIFERFNSTKGGLGLGTTLARLLVEAHGGRISAASSEEEGTTFTIWLPKKVQNT